MLHARDLVPLLANPELIIVRDVLRPAHFVPWSKPVEQLLREMQRRHLHMAFVVDEFGGVMGICTIEDVLEQIVGEIQDEFEEDEDEGKAVEPHADGSFTVHGWATVADFNQAARRGPGGPGLRDHGRLRLLARRGHPGEGRPLQLEGLGLHGRRGRPAQGHQGAGRAREARLSWEGWPHPGRAPGPARLIGLP